ncbi:Vegetative incompatibility protein HET-E-1 [Ceratobasidium sp. AG-Ba]|nr:Vegetative incompatibility protein HET-E-1 [Ceratobasidium sp. AG-Ba]
MDALYTTILHSPFSERSFTENDKMRMEMILRTVVCAKEPLSLAAIASMTGLDLDGVVRPKLRPFLSLLHISGTGIVTTLHKSFHDYLLDTNRSGDFYCDPGSHHNQMAVMCFDEIDRPNPPFNICGLESSYLLDKQVPDLDIRINQSISEGLHYACRYWGDHLVLATVSGDSINRLDHFVHNRFFLWMEVLNLKQSILHGIRTLHKGAQAQGPSSKTKRMIQDVLDFITTLSLGSIFASTPHIYISGLAFWPRDRPVWEHYGCRFSRYVNIKGTAMRKQIPKPIANIDLGRGLYRVAYSPDGQSIVCIHEDKLTLLDAYTGKVIAGMIDKEVYRCFVISVAYSPDGSIIVSSRQDGKIHLWNARTGEQIGRALEGHTDAVNAVAFSREGNRIVSGSDDITLRIWDVQTRRQVGSSLKGHTGPISSIACSLNHDHIATGSYDRTVRIWDSLTGLQVGQALEGHTKSVNSVAYSPDGKYVASGSTDETICVWDAHTRQLVSKLLGALSYVNMVAYSPTGTRIAACIGEYSGSGFIGVWDAKTWQKIGEMHESDESAVHSLAYSPDGSRIVSCPNRDSANSLSVWNALQDPAAVHQINRNNSKTQSIVYSPDGAHLASIAHGKESICVWDIETSELSKISALDNFRDIPVAAYSPDGRYFAYGIEKCKIRLMQTMCIEKHMDVQTDGYCLESPIAYSPDNAFMPTAASNAYTYCVQLLGSRLANR